jgi:hypothetical protein
VKRDAVLNVRVPVDVKRALRKAADDDHGRSISGMVVRVLREWLGDRGYMRVEEPRGVRNRKGKGA